MKNKLIIVVFLLLLSVAMDVEAKDTIMVTNTSDSFMRHYLSDTTGDVPSPGYYTHWSVYVTSTDIPKWIIVTFHFDSGNRSVKVYATPYYTNYVDEVGYMKTFTNKVDVTIEIQ